MGDQAAEHVEEHLGSGLDRLPGMDLLAIDPPHLEAAVGDDAVDLEQMDTLRSRRAGRSAPFAGRGEQRDLGCGAGDGADLAEVVETDLGRGESLEAVREVLSRVAQQAVADAAAGHRPDLLLDGLEQRRPGRAPRAAPAAEGRRW